MSPDGSRLVAVNRQGILSVYDVGSGDLIGSARIPTGTFWFAYFARPDLVRIFARRDQPTTIFEYDVTAKTLVETGQMPKPAYRFNADRSRTLLVTENALEIRDARTGSVLQSVPGRFWNAKFLRDGRIAAIDHDRTALRIFSADGALARDISLPNLKADSIHDIGGGRVVLVMPRARCAVVDIDRGALVRIEEKLRPTSPGNSGPRLLCYSSNGVVIWNPATGEKRLISPHS